MKNKSIKKMNSKNTFQKIVLKYFLINKNIVKNGNKNFQLKELIKLNNINIFIKNKIKIKIIIFIEFKI